jgi:23S rRNA (adenine-N6)-dimethyltransferase
VPQPRPGGRHLLRSRALADAIVADAGIVPGDLVVDLGAGTGMLTGALLHAGARVVAVEADRRNAARLRRACRGAEIVEGDLRRVAWPREPFRVVANLPFALAADVCRALLGDPRVPLVSADLVVEWDFAAKRARLWPATAQTVAWSAWYELAVARRIEPDAFAPRPAVAAGVLRARRRERPLVEPARAAHWAAFVRRGFRTDPRARERDPHAWAAAFGRRDSSVTVAASGRARRKHRR